MKEVSIMHVNERPLEVRWALPMVLVVLAGCGGEALDVLDPGAGSVASVEQSLSPPNDPLFPLQWALRNTGQTVHLEEIGDLVGIKGIDINLLKAWDFTQGSASVVVGLMEELDTDVTHPDLEDSLFVNLDEIPDDDVDNDGNGCVDDVIGCDFVDKNGFGPSFGNGHATHMAGVIAARDRNGQGISGVAPRVRILPMRAFANGPSAVDAIAYAERMGVRIMNVSQGGLDHFDEDVQAAMGDSSILFICSAGNDATARFNFPSSYDLPNVLSVANLTNQGELSPVSSYGETNVDIAAPGAGIISTMPFGEYDYKSGTSPAAAHVTGVAALLLSRNPSMTIGDIVSRILGTGMKTRSLDKVVASSAIVDAQAALAGVLDMGLTARSEPRKITLSWSPQAGATRYQVERDGTLVDNGNSTSFVHANLALDSAHIYRVRPMIGTTYSPLWSRRWLVRASQEPTVEARVLESSHPYQNDSNEEHTVSRRNAKRLRVHFRRVEVLAGDELAFDGADFNPQSIVGNFPNGFWTQFIPRDFKFRLVTDGAGTAFGFAIDKVEYVATVPDAPAAPTQLSIAPGQVTLDFLASPGSVNANIYRSTAKFGGYVRRATVDASVRNYTDGGLTPGRTYYYRVSGSNDFGESPQSAELLVRAQ